MQQVGVGFPRRAFQLPDVGCGKLESIFHKVDVENHVPGVKSWNSNFNFQMLEVEFGISNFPLLGVESWSLISGSWKLDSIKLVWTNSHLNTFSALKRAKKCEKTAVFKGENLLEETPVETRGDP